MKFPIAIALLVTSLCACQSSNQDQTQGAIPDTFPVSVEASTAFAPIVITTELRADGPNGPAPSIYMECESKPKEVAHAVGNPGDGCCGPNIQGASGPATSTHLCPPTPR